MKKLFALIAVFGFLSLYVPATTMALPQDEGTEMVDGTAEGDAMEGEAADSTLVEEAPAEEPATETTETEAAEDDGMEEAAADMDPQVESLNMYIKSHASEYNDYEMCTPEMWKFLADRYGADFEVRRYYKKQQYSYYTACEVAFKLVPIILVYCDQI